MSQDKKTALAREYPPGHILFRESDVGEVMYVIRSGRVKIYRQLGAQELVLAFLGAGEFFGEMALLEGLPRSATAMVTEESVLIEVDGATFEEMIRRNIEIAVRIMRRLASRVRAVDRRLERFMVDTAQGRALEVLRWLRPQGILEGDWIRVEGIRPHLDIAAQAGVPATQAQSVLRRLERAGVLKLEGDDLLVAEKSVLDNYQAYLELKREYAPIASEDEQSSQRIDQQQALRRLMQALQISENEMEQRQQRLVGKYERYLTLRERFKHLDDDLA